MRNLKCSISTSVSLIYGEEEEEEEKIGALLSIHITHTINSPRSVWDPVLSDGVSVASLLAGEAVWCYDLDREEEKTRSTHFNAPRPHPLVIFTRRSRTTDTVHPALAVGPPSSS